MSFAYTISGYNRRRKWRLFNRAMQPRPEARVLDVGFSNEEYSETDNFLEKYYPYQKQITALSIEPSDKFTKRYPGVTAVTYDGGRFPFADKEFDIAWSNAVIEHVGSREDQVNFLREIHRTAQAGFVTTPNKWFPIEVHTRTPLLHWLPKNIFDAYLRLVGKKWATGTYMKLLSVREIKKMLHEAGIDEYTIVKNKLFGFTLDFVVIWGV